MYTPLELASNHLPVRLSTGAAIEISGIWKPCPPGKEQTHELQTTHVNVVGPADPEVSWKHLHIGADRMLLTLRSATDIPDPKEIPHPRLPPPGPPSSLPNTLQLPSIAV